jgi:hypothetical protein
LLNIFGSFMAIAEPVETAVTPPEHEPATGAAEAVFLLQRE